MLFFDLDYLGVEQLLSSWGEPRFRATQIWQGVYQNLHPSISLFPNIPIRVRERFSGELTLDALLPIKELFSKDRKTSKSLFKLADGNLVEAVLMRQDKRRTLCISTQAGCVMGCVFCATGQMGFNRQLTSGEIVAQVIHFARILKLENLDLTNVVLMGMGEPFHNYENSLAAIDRLNDPRGFNLGARRFTISTVGIVPMIRKFADEKRQINLAISLHAVDDEKRSAILPINKRWGIDELMNACRYYISQTGRRLTFEWALIHGTNDSEQVADALARRLNGILSHVNLIPLNPTKDYSGNPASRDSAIRFKNILKRAGIPCTIRARQGLDIRAGCGQLAGTMQSHPI